MKLISVNIQTDLHLDRVLPFLKTENPDVVCVQEIFEKDLGLFEKELGTQGAYAPSSFWESPAGVWQKWGVALFSKYPLANVRTDYYFRNGEELGRDPRIGNRMLVSAEVAVSGKTYRIATTHFTWTQHALNPSEEQKRDLQNMLRILSEFPDLVLCGDFNTNRGGPLFDAIAAKYKDNIPQKYTNSLDSELHYAAHLNLMVDGLFTTPEYSAANVSLREGVSDHRAIVADIEKI